MFAKLLRGAVLLGILGAQFVAQAQTENFDSGASIFTAGPNEWIKNQFFGQSYTFPTSGTGKALRIQANPAPGAAPAAAAILRTNSYSDFYVSLDLVDWAVKDQAAVLLSRWTPAGSGGLADSSGVILNYDVQQDGENAGDRKGGQIQINNVFPGFATVTLGVADITLEPGRSYRLILKGVGTLYTGMIYDLNDLTKPLVTIYANDSTYTSGLCGFLSFSRNGTTGTSDVTIDNYYAGATDPNLSTFPVIPHPVPGTPTVDSRVPSARWKNLYNPASGISFTAKTYSADLIDSAATKLYLNGVDASSQLTLSPNGTAITGSLPGSALQSNTVYSARIELADTTGTKKSTNSFWFDTFSEAFLGTNPVKTVEVEDYNYSGGLYQLDPIPISGLDTNGALVNGSAASGGNDRGYFGRIGTPGVDFSKPGGFYNLLFSEYRTDDRVQITQGSFLTASRDEAGDILDNVSNVPPVRIHDTQRSKYAVSNVFEYQVRLTSPGDWMNYTRSFAPTNYHVYLRCASFGSTAVFLEKVTTDPTISRQELVRYGAFNVGNHIMRLNYRYELLMNGASPAVVSLADTNTLRLTMGGTPIKDERVLVMDYLLFVPTSESSTPVTPVYPPTVLDQFSDGNDTNNPAWDHLDPLGGVTAAPATFTVSNGVYRIVSPVPMAPDAGPARAGSLLRNVDYSDFYVSVDVIDFDDTVRQAFGIAARVSTPGLGTTDGYLFSWEPGSGTLPGTNGGDLDISVLADEAPIRQIETAPSGLHLTRGKSYRFVFMGHGADFEGQVYELPDTTNPLIRLPANDPDNLYPSGLVGLVVADQGSGELNKGDATFDNFLATTDEPRISASLSGSNLNLSWPLIPYRLQSSASLTSPSWSEVTTGITQSGDQNIYSVSATGTERYFRLVYP
ncbi:MAG: hypothetical protein ABIQ35_15140 [Verrucomicrobiota bacterium]